MSGVTTYSVQQNLELLGKYRFLEIQFMELMGSWAYTMTDADIKIGFGRHMFQDSISKKQRMPGINNSSHIVFSAVCLQSKFPLS